MVVNPLSPQILAPTPSAPSACVNPNTKSRGASIPKTRDETPMKSTPFLFTLILTAIAAVAAITECAAQMEYLERAETEASTEGFALRRFILETGPKVHTVMVFDTLPRIRSDELNIRIHYWERHMPQMGPISFNGPKNCFIVGLNEQRQLATSLQAIHNLDAFPTYSRLTP